MSTGGGRKGFSSLSACLDFGAITAMVPTRKTTLAGWLLVGATDYNGGENGVNLSGAMSE